MKNSKRDRFLFCRMTSCFDCEPCKEDCIKKLTVNKGINNISIQEAIEVMAKAMFEWQRPGCRGDVPIEDVWNNEQEGYEKLAEAALNALLEGGNK